MKRYIVMLMLLATLLTSCAIIPEEMIEKIEELLKVEEQVEQDQDEEEEINEEIINKDKIDENKVDEEKIPIETNEELLAMENEMVDLVNQEREKNGLNKLEIDEELRTVARVKSKDIADNDYFDHISPTYGSPFDMMEKFGIRFTQAAENLAGHQSVKQAHEGLMNSKGHRENILNPSLTRIGIGISTDDKYLYIFTQMFITK